jgi:DNA polymerase III subunit delta'
MSFKDFPEHQQGIRLLQRSLERRRLAHAYLFTGHQLDELEGIARALAKTLICLQPAAAGGIAIDSCGACPGCRKVEGGNHADVHWVRPESKSRVITIEQMRELMLELNLKPTEGGYKVAIIVAADRLNVQAANAFLKTLEEPPAKSVLILLSTEPQRMLETMVSRCLRLNFAGDGPRPLAPAEKEWLTRFSEMAASEQANLLGRYRLMGVLLQKLNELKGAIEESLAARSPLERYEEVEKELRDKWEEELAAAVEAEYRRQRTDLVSILQRWLRDVWLQTMATGGELLSFPELTGTSRVARRVTPPEALENLQIIEGTQRLLHTNVQEALALEVGLLKLSL